MIHPIGRVVALTVAALVLAGCNSAEPPGAGGVSGAAPPSGAASLSGATTLSGAASLSGATTIPGATTSPAGRAVVPLAAAPLDISARFRKPVAMGGDCLPRSVVLTNDPAQPTRGFISCPVSGGHGNQVRFLESTATGWRVTRTGLTGAPMAVTDDGRTTFLLYALAQPGQKEYVNVWLLRRSHSGATSSVRLATHLLTASQQEASIVARNGTWWAAWTELNGAGTWVWSAHTLGGRRHAYRSSFQGRSPSLLLQGDSVLLAYTAGFRPEGNTIYTARPSGASWRRQPGSVSGGKESYDDVASHPQLARIGGKVMVAYLKMVLRHKPVGEDDLVLAVRNGNSWTRHSFRTTTAGSPSLIDSAGQPVLAWTAITPHYRGGSGWTAERQLVRMAARHGTRWTTASWRLDTFPYLVAMRSHRGDLVAVVEDDKGQARLLHQ